MRLVIFRSLVVLTVGAAVLIGVLYVASTVDARSPEVITFELTQPLPDDADTALITSSLEVAFNEPVVVDAGATPVTFEPEVEGTVSWSGSTMIFTPRDPLELETEYVVTVGTGIRDRSGNRIGTPPPTFTFETAGRPAVSGSLPEDGGEGVPVEEPILITFSTLMDTASVERALSIDPSVEYELRWSGAVLEIQPTDGLRPGTEYVVRIASDAADVAGVALEDAVEMRFRTVPVGLEPMSVVPADGVDGIAPGASVAVFFDRAIDPESVDGDSFTLEPDVAGTIDVVTADGERVEDEADAASGTILRFAPSGALPLNTTFEVSVSPDVRALDGSQLAEALTWTFTTGAPAATLSNQITYISDRGGVPNVWATNPDGSGEHQVSTELTPVVDYAVAPDGSAIVVADGRRLVAMRADGSDRRVLTDERHLEFDPSYAPNGQRVAFARADAETGAGLGLWLMPADGGDATQVEMPSQPGPDSTESPDDDDDDAGSAPLRAPRFSPDGQALAFVDADGWVAILELPAERLTRVEAHAAAPPAWTPDSASVLVTHLRDGGGPAEFPPAGPLEPVVASATDLTVSVLNRSGTTLRDSGIRDGSVILAVDRGGAIAYVDGDGRLHVTDDLGDAGDGLDATDGEVASAAFAPGEEALVVVVADGDDGWGRVDVIDLATRDRTVLSERGASPRWLP